MDHTVSEEFLNDNSKLELKVLRALTRLQKKTSYSGKLKKKAGVTLMQIVKYLKANYPDLDGDVVSQVITALVQCIKNGMVCALDNGRYLFLGPQTRTMISNCFVRTVHGARCSCAKKVPYLNACCTINVNVPNQGTPKKRQTKRKRTNSESPETEMKLDNAETTLCDCCFEIHPVSNKSPKKKMSPTRKVFMAPFDTFSPRDEVNCSLALSKVTKK